MRKPTRWDDADQAWDKCVEEARQMMAWASKLKSGFTLRIVIHPAILSAMEQQKDKKERKK